MYDNFQVGQAIYKVYDDFSGAVRLGKETIIAVSEKLLKISGRSRAFNYRRQLDKSIVYTEMRTPLVAWQVYEREKVRELELLRDQVHNVKRKVQTASDAIAELKTQRAE